MKDLIPKPDPKKKIKTAIYLKAQQLHQQAKAEGKNNPESRSFVFKNL